MDHRGIASRLGIETTSFPLTRFADTVAPLPHNPPMRTRVARTCLIAVAAGGAASAEGPVEVTVDEASGLDEERNDRRHAGNPVAAPRPRLWLRPRSSNLCPPTLR